MRANQWRKKHAFETWLSESKRARLSRLSTVYFYLSSSKPIGRQALQKLRLHKNSMQKIKRCFASDTDKNVCAGMGHLRMWMKRASLRIAFVNWLQFNAMHRNLEVAQRFHERTLRRCIVRHLKSHALNESQLRTDAQIETSQLALTQIMDDDVAKTSRTDPGIAIITSAPKRDKARRQNEARQRQRHIQKELDAHILLQQRDERRKRVAQLCTQREKSFHSLWDANKKAAETACIESTKTWMRSSDFKNQSQKMQKELHRLLSIKFASASDTTREKAISSRAVISYGILDAKLAHVAGVPLDDVFLRLEPTPAPISSASFQAAIVSCGPNLSITEVNELFHAMAEDGTITLPILRGLRQLAEKFIGQEGTRWKMYVCPIVKTVVLHNVATDTKIFEKEVSDRHIRHMVNDNMQDLEMLKVRRKHSEARRKAYSDMLEHHAAKSIQSLFHRSKAMRSMKEQRWIVEKRKLQQLRTDQTVAAQKIQKQYRSTRSIA
jgi:hypothetical protein